MTRLDHSRLRQDERWVNGQPPSAPYRLALAYANSYHVGMSSLGFQRVYDLVSRAPEWSCERLFFEDDMQPRSIESESPLASFGCVAFSVSFEEDYVNLLRMLAASGVPLRRRDRRDHHPLIVLGGSCAMINPLPLAEFVDVFALGAAENLLGELLAALESEPDHASVRARLAQAPGFYVPGIHQPSGELGAKLDKLELSAEQMLLPGHLPTSVIVTPHTEFADKYLVEMSRGCPEKCRYCWATFGMGTFRWHPTEYLLAALDRAREVTDQVGFLATAVGDHPEVERILMQAADSGMRAAVSSIRIPAVTEGVLQALVASGDRSITLAPETGSDALRRAMGKPISNELLLEKVRLIFRSGMRQLKLYFLIGLPGETDEDVQAIVDLAAAARRIMLEEMRATGSLGHIHLGVNPLIPKPYTPWQREPFAPPATLRRRVGKLRRGVGALANVSLGPVSLRQAMWQAYLSKAGPDAAELLASAAAGTPIAQLLRQYRAEIEAEIFPRLEGDLRWHFMRAGRPVEVPITAGAVG